MLAAKLNGTIIENIIMLSEQDALPEGYVVCPPTHGIGMDINEVVDMTPMIELHKKNACIALTRKFMADSSAPIEFMGHMWQAGERSRKLLQEKITLAQFTRQYPDFWLDINNEKVVFPPEVEGTPHPLVQLLAAINDRQDALFLELQEHKELIRTPSSSIDDVNELLTSLIPGIVIG